MAGRDWNGTSGGWGGVTGFPSSGHAGREGGITTTYSHGLPWGRAATHFFIVHRKQKGETGPV